MDCSFHYWLKYHESQMFILITLPFKRYIKYSLHEDFFSDLIVLENYTNIKS